MDKKFVLVFGTIVALVLVLIVFLLFGLEFARNFFVLIFVLIVIFLIIDYLESSKVKMLSMIYERDRMYIEMWTKPQQQVQQIQQQSPIVIEQQSPKQLTVDITDGDYEVIKKGA